MKIQIKKMTEEERLAAEHKAVEDAEALITPLPRDENEQLKISSSTVVTDVAGRTMNKKYPNPALVESTPYDPKEGKATLDAGFDQGIAAMKREYNRQYEKLRKLSPTGNVVIQGCSQGWYIQIGESVSGSQNGSVKWTPITKILDTPEKAIEDALAKPVGTNYLPPPPVLSSLEYNNKEQDEKGTLGQENEKAIAVKAEATKKIKPIEFVAYNSSRDPKIAKLGNIGFRVTDRLGKIILAYSEELKDSIEFDISNGYSTDRDREFKIPAGVQPRLEFETRVFIEKKDFNPTTLNLPQKTEKLTEKPNVINLGLVEEDKSVDVTIEAVPVDSVENKDEDEIESIEFPVKDLSNPTASTIATFISWSNIHKDVFLCDIEEIGTVAFDTRTRKPVPDLGNSYEISSAIMSKLLENLPKQPEIVPAETILVTNVETGETIPVFKEHTHKPNEIEILLDSSGKPMMKKLQKKLKALVGIEVTAERKYPNNGEKVTGIFAGYILPNRDSKNKDWTVSRRGARNVTVFPETVQEVGKIEDLGLV